MVLRRMPFLTGKCFFKSTASSTGGRLWPGAAAVTGRLSVATSAIQLLRMPARGPMAWPLLFIGGELRPALLVGKRAARRERTARRQDGQRRHHPGDLLQAGRLGRFLTGYNGQMRNRAKQAVRVGMERRLEQLLDIGFLDLLAGVHHDNPVRRLGDDREVV